MSSPTCCAGNRDTPKRRKWRAPLFSKWNPSCHPMIPVCSALARTGRTWLKRRKGKRPSRAPLTAPKKSSVGLPAYKAEHGYAWDVLRPHRLPFDSARAHRFLDLRARFELHRIDSHGLCTFNVDRDVVRIEAFAGLAAGPFDRCAENCRIGLHRAHLVRENQFMEVPQQMAVVFANHREVNRIGVGEQH